MSYDFQKLSENSVNADKRSSNNIVVAIVAGRFTDGRTHPNFVTNSILVLVGQIVL